MVFISETFVWRVQISVVSEHHLIKPEVSSMEDLSEVPA